MGIEPAINRRYRIIISPSPTSIIREQMAAVAKASNDAIAAIDMHGTVTLWNQAAERLYGYPASEILGHSLALVFPERHEHELQILLDRVARGERVVGLESTRLCKDGRVIDVTVSAYPIQNESGTIVGAVAVVRDLPEEKQRVRGLQQQDRLMRTTFQEATVGMALADMGGRILHSNPALQHMLGYNAPELTGRMFTAVTHPADVATDRALAEEIWSGKRKGYQIEKRYLRKDGSTVWGRLNVSLVDSAEATPFVVATVEDITPQKRVEELAREREDQYRGIFESTSDGLVIRDVHGTIVEANPAMCRMHGYSETELAALAPGALVHPDFADQFAECLRTVRDGGEFRAERVDLRKDGTSFPVEVHETGLSYRGRPHILGVVRDISERKAAEAKAREKEDQYRRVFEASGDGLTITDPNTGIVVEVNRAFCTLIGYSREELVGHHASMFIHPDSHGLFADFLDDAGQGRAFHGRAVNVRKDGSLVPVEVRGSSFLYQGRPHVLGVIRDVTEQVAAYELLEQRVEERTRELSTLLDVSRDVASTLELRPLLRTILEQLHHVVEYVDCTIMRIDGDHLLNLDYRGPLPAEEVLSIAVPIAAIPGLWRDLSCGQPVVIADLRSSDPAAGEFWDAIGEENRSRYLHLRSWLGVPLMAKDQVVGLLTIMHDQPGFYTPHHAELALAIAQHAAIAVENAQLYGQAQELAATEERARLARELHDSVTQALFSMTMHARAAELAMANQGISPDSGVAENLRQLSDLAQGGLAEMRSLIFELRPGALQEEGLIAALRKHCRALTAREGVSIDVDAPAERIPLDPTEEEHLYRLTQEALHNVVKHAAASHVLVRLAHQDGRLLLEVKDDGLGFDPAAIPVGHLGLETMRTRAQSIGAEIAISSAPGEGTTIRVLVPSRGSEGLHG